MNRTAHQPLVRPWAASLLLLTASGALLTACGSGDAPSAAGSEAADLFTVSRGPMRISVREAAELKATRETRIRSEVEGQANIIYLIPEGTVVEAGERVAELDVSEVEERRANQAITVERARATLVNARQNIEILEKELAAEEAEARSTLEIAQIDLEKFLGRTRPAEASDGDTIPEDLTVSQLTETQLTVAPPTETPPAVTPPSVPHVEETTVVETTATEMPPSAAPTTLDEDGAPAVAVRESQGRNRDVYLRVVDLVAERPQYASLPAKLLTLLGRTPEQQQDALDRDMGELGQQVLEQIDEIRLATQQLRLDDDRLYYSEKLKDKDYITKNDYESDRLRAETQRSKVELAWQKLDILVSYTLRKTQIDLELKYNNALIGLERVRASNEARRAREEAELSSREAEFTVAEERLQNFDHQLAHAVILAPNPGLVVYAEVDSRGREMIQEGVEVRERQTLIILPDVTNMTAELKIQEADIDKIRVGQPASIQIDAFPDKALSGKVSRVSPVADSGSRWSNNNLKVYKTWVDLDVENNRGELRPNMSATVEILVGEVPDTITVPITAVRRQGAIKYVWKATSSGPQPVEVTIGRNTLSHVEVLEGIAAGEQIYLAPPPGMAVPEFEQPQMIEEIRELEPGGSPSGLPASGTEAAPPAAEPVTRETFQAAVVQKFPAFKEQVESEGMRALFTNPELREAIENDPDLQVMQAQLVEQMRARRGSGGGMPGGGPPGGATPGGGRRGESGDGGAGPRGARRGGGDQQGTDSGARRGG